MKKVKIIKLSTPESLTGIINFGYAQVPVTDKLQAYNGQFPLPAPTAGHVWIQVYVRTTTPADVLNKEFELVAQKTTNGNWRYGTSREAITQTGIAKANSSKLGKFANGLDLLAQVSTLATAKGLNANVVAQISDKMINSLVSGLTNPTSNNVSVSAPISRNRIPEGQPSMDLGGN